MKRSIFIIIVSLLLFFYESYAQTDVELDTEFGARVSVGVDKEINQKVRLSLEEELRFDDNLRGFNRMQTTIQADYKLLRGVKFGVGYMLVNPYSSSENSFSNARHRCMFDIAGSLRYGQWRFSLKERFQATYRSGDFNTYQNPRTALSLKSRFMVKYKYSEFLLPYAYVELRNTLNAPVVSAYYDGSNYVTASGSTTGEEGWFLDGFNGCYVNRIRLGLGMDVHKDIHNAFTVCLMLDRVSNKIVDANAAGTKLKSYTKEVGFVGNIGFNYVYSF